MSKHIKEFKIEPVVEYLSGKLGGRRSVANKYDILEASLKIWLNKYKSGGFDHLSKKLKNNKFIGKSKILRLGKP